MTGNERRLAEIEARAAAATAGPWQANHGFCWTDGDPWNITPGENTAGPLVWGTFSRGLPLLDDLAFAAHAREDVPWLIEELRETRERLGLLQARVRDRDALVARHRIVITKCERAKKSLRGELHRARDYRRLAEGIWAALVAEDVLDPPWVEYETPDQDVARRNEYRERGTATIVAALRAANGEHHMTQEQPSSPTVLDSWRCPWRHNHFVGLTEDEIEAHVLHCLDNPLVLLARCAKEWITMLGNRSPDEAAHAMHMLPQVNKWLEEARRERDEALACLQDIVDIGFDRDGCANAESLGALVDELVALARRRKPHATKPPRAASQDAQDAPAEEQGTSPRTERTRTPPCEER